MKTTQIQVSNLNQSLHFYQSILGFQNASICAAANSPCAILSESEANVSIELEQTERRIDRRRLPFCLPLTAQRAQVVLAAPSKYLASLSTFAPATCCKLPVGVADPDGHLVGLCIEPVRQQKIASAGIGFWQRFVTSFSQLADFHGYYR